MGSSPPAETGRPEAGLGLNWFIMRFSLLSPSRYHCPGEGESESRVRLPIEAIGESSPGENRGNTLIRKWWAVQGLNL